MAVPFHYTATQTAPEGIYRVRLYCVPKKRPDDILVDTYAADASLMPMRLQSHMKYLTKHTTKAALPSGVLRSLGTIGVSSESEFEQGLPKVDTLKLAFAGCAELKALSQAARSAQWQVWCEVVLEQKATDLPDGDPGLVGPKDQSITWPLKNRLVFWGLLMNPSLQQKPHVQRLAKRTRRIDNANVGEPALRRYTQSKGRFLAYDGTIEMEFTHWSIAKAGDVNGMLAAVELNTTPSIGRLILAILSYLSPADNYYVADRRLRAVGWAIATLSYDSWGETQFAVSADNVAWHTNINEMYLDTTKALFYNDPKGANDQSFYGWKTLGEGFAKFMRELLLSGQIELPTMEDAGADDIPPITQTALPTKRSMRVLMAEMDSTPLPIWIDADEDPAVNDAGAWASSYKVEEPTGSGLFPDPNYTIAYSEMNGGSDQSYKTMLRLVGKSIQGGLLLDDVRGWEILCKDALGNMKTAKYVRSSNAGTVNDWSQMHAIEREARWGSPRAVVTIKGAGVGIEPFCASATQHGSPIAQAKKVFGFWDWSEFPLSRAIQLQPGVLSTIGDDDLDALDLPTSKTFSVIGCRRTPGDGTKEGDIELKLIEIAGDAFGGDVWVPPDPPVAPPPPPPPPGPPTTQTDITNLTGVIHSLLDVKATAYGAAPDFPIAQVTLRVDNTLVDTAVWEKSDGYYHFAFDTTKFSGTLLSPQTHTLVVTAYGTSGASASDTHIITIGN